MFIWQGQLRNVSFSLVLSCLAFCLQNLEKSGNPWIALSLDLKLWLFAAVWFSSIAKDDTRESQALRDSDACW